MDLSMLPPPVSEYDNQRTEARFTVRSANYLSYSLTCRPDVRKPKCFSEEEGKSAEEVDKRERYTGSDGTTKVEDHTVTGYQARTGSRSSVRGQCEKEDTSSYKISTELNQNGTAVKTITEFGTDGNRKCNPGSESRGRTDWRKYNLPSRSKSLDWGAGASNPDRGKMADMLVLPTKRGMDKRRIGVEDLRARFISSIQSHNSAGTSNVERSPWSHMSQTLDRASKGQSRPTRLRSLSGPGSCVGETASSLGPKGGQSIVERIEKLYGSAGFSKTEDSGTIRDFSNPATSHHREATTDSLISPQQKSYEWTSGGTFPRRLSSGDKKSLSLGQSRTSFTWTQKDTPGSETSLLPQTRMPTVGLPGVKWQGQIQGRYSEVGGVNLGTGFEEMGTRSLDRASSRYSIAAQIRSARAAAGITSPPHSNSFLEEDRSVSLRDLSGVREGRASGDGSTDQDGMKGETNGIQGTLRERTAWQPDDVAKAKTDSKSSCTDEDVFDPNPQKGTVKSIERKKLPERLSAASAASVRNKINQFEALAQRAHGLATGQALMPRRAFSVPTHLSYAHEGVKKSRSEKAIGGLRYKWEGLKEGGEAGDGTEDKVTGGRKNLGSNRSLSVDEIGLRLGRQEREGNDLVESEVKEMDSINNCADFGKYSSHKTTLEISLNGGAQRKSRNFYIDEIDLYRTSSPEEASERPPSSRLSNSAGVQKTTSPRVTSPVSDEDTTPTNSPNNSPLPFLTPTTQPENVIPIAHSTNESTSVLTQAAKIPKQDSPLLPRPLATSSHSNLPDVINTAQPNGKKKLMDLNAWVAGLKPNIMIWNDEDDEDGYDDDDESTQKDEDSNYDSDSGESSVTITGNMSQSEHKSFCVSLSDLCNFTGVDYESENDSDEWQSTKHRTSSLSSDMSALSYVSVMPSDELDRLLEDVRSVGDSTLQDYNDVQVVVLHKDVGVGLGFSVAGGVDQNKPVTVHKVFHAGVAAQEGSIREGDQVLSINGTALCSYAHWEALRVLRRAKTREMGVVVLRRGGMNGVRKGGAQTNNQGQTQTQFTETGQHVCVRLEKNTRDLGFSLEGGVDSNRGNRPLTVQKIFQGGPVDMVRPGDEVEQIEGMSVVGMRRLEAWTLIRRLPPGPVDVVLRRSVKHLET